jgi:hypothetical protein
MRNLRYIIEILLGQSLCAQKDVLFDIDFRASRIFIAPIQLQFSVNHG